MKRARAATPRQRVDLKHGATLDLGFARFEVVLIQRYGAPVIESLLEAQVIGLAGGEFEVLLHLSKSQPPASPPPCNPPARKTPRHRSR